MNRASSLTSWLPAVAVAAVLAGCGGPEHIPLGQTGAHGSSTLPADAVVVDVAIDREPGSGEACMLVPEGSLDGGGTKEFPFEVTASVAGDHTVWVHAKWSNSCGNSVGLRLPDQPDRVIGEDAVYGEWHWVRGPAVSLPAAAVRCVLFAREDGVAVDQVALVRERDFVPVGRLGADRRGQGQELRRFADDFNRSPGHGLENWQTYDGAWEIAFSFDPNRIPNQYALHGKQTEEGRPALILTKGEQFGACRVDFNVCPVSGDCGVLAGFNLTKGGPAIEPLYLTFTPGSDGKLVVVNGLSREYQREVPIGNRLRYGQWHHVTLEAWPYAYQVSLDGEVVYASTAGDVFTLRAGDVGLLTSGEASFDDVLVVEIPMVRDLPRERLATASWQLDPGADWYYEVEENRWFKASLVAGGGIARLRDLPFPVAEIAIAGGAAGGLRVMDGTGKELGRLSGERAFLPVSGDVRELAFEPVDGKAKLTGLGVRMRPPVEPDNSVIGPYDFSTATLIDPADYLDFTPEEEAAMNADPAKADVNKREPRVFPVVSRGESKSAWQILSPAWKVHDGYLEGLKPGATVRYTQPVGTLCTLSTRVRLGTPQSAVTLRLYVGDDRAIAVPVTGDRLGDTGWHRVAVACAGSHYTVSIDDAALPPQPWTRGFGTHVELAVDAGTASFDDIAIDCPRHIDGDRLYTFERREPDWWRQGGEWADHAGIACVIASNWISLAAPRGSGVLWNKHPVTGDLSLATSIEEYSEWFGWHAKPHSHEHHPFDHVQLLLGDAAESPVYVLEVNADNRTATILTRLGKEVARCPQDASFPIRYVGGHAPYTPRRNHLQLLRQGARLRAFVNDVQVIDWTDPEPLPVATVGIGGHDTHVNFTRIEVRELAPE